MANCNKHRMGELYREFSIHIDRIKNSNLLIIVEGKKDRAALEHFGITNTIELSKKPLFQIIEDVAAKNKDCIILTDLDAKGRELYVKLSRGLSHLGVKIDDSFRNFLRRETQLRQIEGLWSYVEKLSKAKD